MHLLIVPYSRVPVPPFECVHTANYIVIIFEAYNYFDSLDFLIAGKLRRIRRRKVKSLNEHVSDDSLLLSRNMYLKV